MYNQTAQYVALCELRILLCSMIPNAYATAGASADTPWRNRVTKKWSAASDYVKIIESVAIVNINR